MFYIEHLFFLFQNYLANIQCVLYTGASNTQKNSVLHLQNYLAAISSRDEGKHYILVPVSKIGIFRDHVAPPDFAENTDMAKDLDYKMGLDFGGLFFFFFFGKNPRLIGGLIRYLRFDIFIEKIS